MEQRVRELLTQLVTSLGRTEPLRECILKQLDELYQTGPANGKVEEKKLVRVYMDGCFDIMHSGHYNAIRQAKQLGDILVVGVHSDEEILLHKGPTTTKDAERLAMVKACKWVDEVVFGVPYVPTRELLEKLNCDFVVHGDDMPTNADGKSAYGALLQAGKCKIIKRTEGISSTDLVGRLLLLTHEHHLPPSQTRTLGSTNTISDEMTKSGSCFLPTTQRIVQFSKFASPQSHPCKEPDKIVYLAGAFDLFHVGHLEILEAAKKLGDFLLVGVHDDQVVNALRGKNYPIMNLHERVLNVLSCKWVDEVILGAPFIITSDMISSMNVHLVVSANLDYSPEQFELDPFETAKELGLFQELQCPISLTTEIIEQRILSHRDRYEELYEKKKKKQDAYHLESECYRHRLKEL